MIIRSLILVAGLSIIHGTVLAQNQKKTIDPSMNEFEDNYLNRQSEAFLNEISATLKEFPPQHPFPRERELSLFLLDALLHDKYAAHRPAVQRFYKTQIITAIDEMQHFAVSEGAKIWKLYNMGFVIRTKSITIAFDLTSGESAGSDGFTISNKNMIRIVNQCDALFISHRHRDHKDLWIAEQFIAQNKPVIAPPQVWEGKPIHEKITHLKREAHTIQKLPIKNNSVELDVVVYPGHQMSKLENNVPLIYTPEGISFAHMGDQINEGDFIVDYEWIDHVKEHHKVDILLPPSWTNEIHRIVQGFDPKLVIPGHENELGHSLDDRVPFWGDSEFLELTYAELKASNYPVVIMSWGESYHYMPDKNK